MSDLYLRQQIIQQAARLLAESVEVDYFAAKTKAAKMLGYRGQKNLPSNQEIDTALKDYQSIFFAESQPLVIKDKRREALLAMQHFSQFTPRLVGSVFEGTATENSPIEIHLFVDSLEEVTLFLMDHKISYEITDRQIRANKRESLNIPMIHFFAGEHDIEMHVFPYNQIRCKNFNPDTGLVQARADIKKVKNLLAE